jgi:hypothetical protein
MRASTLSFVARSMDLMIYSAITGVIGASISIRWTLLAGATDVVEDGCVLTSFVVSSDAARTIVPAMIRKHEKRMITNDFDRISMSP